ncbi:hypothetical protein ANN_24065 [Periplaneta americana]|uniref:Uncharacterized protein n=1 Tax=Periplaneta americana TaxID=6978 RepID=A0ABQ8S217_PERAM|nr:hypothetical protein ANN_24065 [Periplaneta americana]
MAGLCEGGNEPSGSLKAITLDQGWAHYVILRNERCVLLRASLASALTYAYCTSSIVGAVMTLQYEGEL